MVLIKYSLALLTWIYIYVKIYLYVKRVDYMKVKLKEIIILVVFIVVVSTTAIFIKNKIRIYTGKF